MRRSREPVLWALFSSGGMISALFLPSVIFLLWVAQPLGWVDAGSTYRDFADVATHPIVRFFLFVLISLSLFHWAHRFRYTLYDGLKLYYLNKLVATITYGTATIVTLVAGYVILVL